MSIADKLATIAENIPKVYQAGYDKGVAEGDDSYYDTFWDDYQDYGNRVDYENAFVGRGWTAKNFKPKYDMRPTGRGAVYMFGRNAFANDKGEIVDLTELLEKSGVTLDFSNAEYAGYAFNGNYIKRVPIIDGSKTLKNLNEVFNYAYVLEVIDGLILQADGSNTFNLTFNGTVFLREITIIEGVIGSSISIQSIHLNKHTITNVINHLSDTTSELTASFSRTAVNNAFETAEGKKDGSTSAEWLALVATKPNWTISLN